MLLDPVDGFFAGIGKGLIRYLIGASALFAGSAVCLLPNLFRADGNWKIILLLWPLYFGGTIFYWAMLGFWYVIGLASLITMLAALLAFAQDRFARITYFASFTAAAIYFAPFCKDFTGSTCSTIAYTACAIIYWGCPPVIGWCKRIFSSA